MKRILSALLIAVVLVGCNTGGGLIGVPFSGQALNGTYQGTWNNTTFGSSGAAQTVINANDATKSGTLVMNFDGNVLGQGDPPADNFNLTYNDNGLTFSGASNAFGALTMSIDRDGNIQGTGLNPSATVSRIDFNGSITSTGINLTYVVTFAAGGTATGTVTMPKQAIE